VDPKRSNAGLESGVISPMGSVDKALRALQQLGESGAVGLPLSRLAADLKLNKTSLHRTLSALRLRGFVDQDGTGHYRLGNALLALADAHLRDQTLSNLLHHGLVSLCTKINETCHLGVMMGEQVVYIDKVEPQRPIRVWSEIGLRNPAVTTALGRAIMSQTFLDFQSFTTRFSKVVPDRTNYTRRSLQKVWSEIIEARRLGFSKEEQENELGVSCIATSVLRGGNAVAAISITAPIERMNSKRYPILIRTLRECIEPRLPPGLTLQRPIPLIPQPRTISAKKIAV
jgi:IclR family acetate operon transcriptional repressor